MFQKSTSNKDPLFAIRFLLALIFTLFFAAQTLGTPLKPIRIFFPGNFAGKAVTLSESLEPLPEGCWKAPSLLKSFTDRSSGIDLVIGPGNNSSIYLPASFLAAGGLEQEILGKCIFDACAVGPNDLLMFRNSLLSPEIRNCVITNLEPVDNFSIFTPYKSFVKATTRFWLFNYIGENGFKQLPLQKWGGLIPEDPSRSLRRMNLKLNRTDICIHVAHMNKQECLKLANELKNWPGTHIITQVVGSNIPAEFSTILPEREGQIFFVSLEKGWERLPMLKIVRRSNGYPRLSLRMLPYAKAESGNSLKDFARYRKNLGKILYETLTFVPTTLNPSTVPFQFHPDLYARFAREQMRSDVAIIVVPEEKFKTDNVINMVSCLSAFPNEKLFKFRISGEKLETLIQQLIVHTSQRLRFSGCKFAFFANRPKNIQIGKYELLPHKFYNVCVNQRILDDPVLANYFSHEKIEPFDGTTFWDVWKKQLKSHRIEKVDLMESLKVED